MTEVPLCICGWSWWIVGSRSGPSSKATLPAARGSRSVSKFRAPSLAADAAAAAPALVQHASVAVAEHHHGGCGSVASMSLRLWRVAAIVAAGSVLGFAWNAFGGRGVGLSSHGYIKPREGVVVIDAAETKKRHEKGSSYLDARTVAFYAS